MPTFATHLKSERQRGSWSQEQFAELLGTTATNVSRWERGVTVPKPYFRQRLCQVLGKSAEELGLLGAPVEAETPPLDHEQSPRLPSLVKTSFPRWYLPHQRNPLFTGRKVLLECLHHTLNEGGAVALAQMHAISGLGGIGKTQTAIEYAYRYADVYQMILWVRGESRDVFLSDIVALAEAFHLIVVGEASQQHSAITAIRQWLQEHSGWLLIVDNLEDLSLLREMLPGQSTGHILVTTRAQSVGPRIRRLDLETMEPDEGALFLLRRTKRIGPADTSENASQADRDSARAISQLVDGLPLALDQAGAYIEETGCSLGRYLTLYQRHDVTMLGMRDLSDGINADHPLSVRATLALTLEQIRRANPLALDLLCLCAFLNPDAIPEELLLASGSGASADFLGSPLDLDAAIAELRRYSLLRRNPETQTLSLHRLVQVVVKDTLDEAAQRQWALRAVQVISWLFPRVERRVTSSQCQRYFAQAQNCAVLIEAWDILSLEAGQFLTRFTSYVFELGDYEFTPLVQTEPLLTRALASLTGDGRKVCLETADAYLMLGRVYSIRWDSEQSARYLRQALAIYEQVSESDQRNLRECLSSLGDLYLEVDDDYAQAEQFYRRALAISEQVRGMQHPDVVTDLRDLGTCLYLQTRYTEAETLLLRALAICQQALGMGPILTASLYHALGLLYSDNGADEKAESFFWHCIEIRQAVLKPPHLHTAMTLRGLGKLYLRQHRYTEAEPILEQALDICRRVMGAEHALTCTVMQALGKLYEQQGQVDRAESLLRQTYMIRQKILGADHPDTISVRDDLEAWGRQSGQPAPWASDRRGLQGGL